MIRFSLFGIPIEVQPFFWLTLVILGGASSADTKQEILGIGLFVIAGFISILVHELGHALTMRRFGAQPYISLVAFGGYAAYSGVQMSRRQRFLITAAGPAVQIALGIAVFFLARSIPNLSEHGRYFLRILVYISFVWAIINLLPVLPLDGGQLLDAILGPERVKITLWTTIIVAVVAGFLIFKETGSVIFPIFLGMYGWQAFQRLKEEPWR